MSSSTDEFMHSKCDSLCTQYKQQQRNGTYKNTTIKQSPKTIIVKNNRCAEPTEMPNADRTHSHAHEHTFTHAIPCADQYAGPFESSRNAKRAKRTLIVALNRQFIRMYYIFRTDIATMVSRTAARTRCSR